LLARTIDPGAQLALAAIADAREPFSAGSIAAARGQAAFARAGLPFPALDPDAGRNEAAPVDADLFTLARIEVAALLPAAAASAGLVAGAGDPEARIDARVLRAGIDRSGVLRAGVRKSRVVAGNPAAVGTARPGAGARR
jgi:hypothetical protein